MGLLSKKKKTALIGGTLVALGAAGLISWYKGYKKKVIEYDIEKEKNNKRGAQ